MKTPLLVAALLSTTLLTGALIAQPSSGERMSARGGQGAPAFAGGGHGSFAGGAGPMAEILATPFWERERVLEALDLTPTQIAQLKESREVLLAGKEARRDAIKAAHTALREEMQKDEPSLSTALRLQDAVNAATNAERRAILGHVVTVKNILTEEQEEALKKVMRERHQERRGPSARRGPGSAGAPADADADATPRGPRRAR